jgi:hypothetical protein
MTRVAAVARQCAALALYHAGLVRWWPKEPAG